MMEASTLSSPVAAKATMVEVKAPCDMEGGTCVSQWRKSLMGGLKTAMHCSSSLRSFHCFIIICSGFSLVVTHEGRAFPVTVVSKDSCFTSRLLVRHRSLIIVCVLVFVCFSQKEESRSPKCLQSPWIRLVYG